MKDWSTDRLKLTKLSTFGDYEIKRIRRGNRITQERNSVQISDGQEQVAISHRWSVARQGQDPDQPTSISNGKSSRVSISGTR